MVLRPMRLIWITVAFFWMLESAQPVLIEPAGKANKFIALIQDLTTP